MPVHCILPDGAREGHSESFGFEYGVTYLLLLFIPPFALI